MKKSNIAMLAAAVVVAVLIVITIVLGRVAVMDASNGGAVPFGTSL